MGSHSKPAFPLRIRRHGQLDVLHITCVPLERPRVPTQDALHTWCALSHVQAMIDVAGDAGWLGTTLSCINLVQCLMQVGFHEWHGGYGMAWHDTACPNGMRLPPYKSL